MNRNKFITCSELMFHYNNGLADVLSDVIEFQTKAGAGICPEIPEQAGEGTSYCPSFLVAVAITYYTQLSAAASET